MAVVEFLEEIVRVIWRDNELHLIAKSVSINLIVNLWLLLFPKFCWKWAKALWSEDETYNNNVYGQCQLCSTNVWRRSCTEILDRDTVIRVIFCENFPSGVTGFHQNSCYKKWFSFSKGRKLLSVRNIKPCKKDLIIKGVKQKPASVSFNITHY